MAKKRAQSILKSKKIMAGSLLIILILLFIYLYIKPSNNRDWSADQKTLSHAQIDNEEIKVYNVRNFTYYNTSIYTPSYYNETLNLSELDSLWYIVEPFSGIKGSAHTFLSFGFDKKFLSISVEIRKEKGESYSPINGLFKRYELMYVLGDENDLIKLRAVYRNDTVFLYPINTTKEKMQLVFLDMLARTNNLQNNPEFYNTLTNTCTTNLVNHVNKISPHRVPFNLKVIFPAYSDELAYNLGLINTTLSFEHAREKFKINDRAKKYENYSDFSLKIRQFDEKN